MIMVALNILKGVKFDHEIPTRHLNHADIRHGIQLLDIVLCDSIDTYNWTFKTQPGKPWKIKNLKNRGICDC